MLRDEFEKAYCERSKITVEKYRQSHVALPCNCGDDGCEGWASVSLTDVGLLLSHLWLDLPEIPMLREMEAAEMRHGPTVEAGQ